MMKHRDWQPYTPARIETPALVAEFDLALATQALTIEPRFVAARVLVRLLGAPVGYVDVTARAMRQIERADILSSLDPAAHERAHALLDAAWRCQGRGPLSPDTGLAEALDALDAAPAAPAGGPLVTVAVCTRDRADSLRETLESLARQSYRNLEIVVIDNAPRTAATAELLRTRFPTMRYVCERRPGLDNARNRAIKEAHGEILAYIDDDARADAGWVAALVGIFETTDAMCVTGMVAPAELETPAQALFERRGYSKSFDRLVVDIHTVLDRPFPYFTCYIGTGCNSAYRRSVFEQVGPFDPRLDMGTPVPGGGDHDMFARVIRAGHTLIYDPAPIVFHHHIVDMDVLLGKLIQYEHAFTAFIAKQIVDEPRRALPVLGHLLRSTLRKTVRGVGATLIKRDRPLALVLNPLRSLYQGPAMLYRSHRLVQRQALAEADTEPILSGAGRGDERSLSCKV